MEMNSRTKVTYNPCWEGLCLHTQDPNWLRRHRAVVQGDKIVKKYGQQNHDTNPVQKRVREEEDKAINVASTNHTWHNLKNLVARFEGMATNLFMD